MWLATVADEVVKEDNGKALVGRREGAGLGEEIHLVEKVIQMGGQVL